MKKITEAELEEISAAAAAVEEYGVAPERIPWRIDPGRGAFVTLTPAQARRLVAAVRDRRSESAARR